MEVVTDKQNYRIVCLPFFFGASDYKLQDEEFVLSQRNSSAHELDVNNVQEYSDDQFHQRVFNKFFIATEGTLQFCVFTEGEFLGCTLETKDDEGRLAEGSIWCEFVCVLERVID